VVSSKICTDLVPSADPVAATDSKSSGTSRCWSVRIPADEPPAVQNLSRCPPRIPPDSSSNSRSVMPSGASYVPGVLTWPERLKIPQPLDFSVPMLANQSAPLRMIGTALAIDSTLFTFVGRAYTPATAGNGGLFRGSPRLPSSESSSAVSSPQM
jgi:hypothetical protein